MAKIAMCVCSHVKPLHADASGRCRINGCPCEEYREPGAPAPEDGEGRLVSFIIPIGYALTITLIPIEEKEGS